MRLVQDRFGSSSAAAADRIRHPARRPATVGSRPFSCSGVAGRREKTRRRSHSPLPSGSLTSFWSAARPIVCSPTRSARLLPASADANSSAAPEVPVSISSDVGSVMAPSPATARDRLLRRRPSFHAAPACRLATNSRASARPLVERPLDVRRTSTISLVAPLFVRSAICDFTCPACRGPIGGDAHVADAWRGDASGDVGRRRRARASARRRADRPRCRG